MMQNDIENDINRILVSLDFNDYGPSFIEPLVALASQLNADLCGLFIEDPELQQIANLPFSREITFPLAHTRNLNSHYIARHLKHNVEALRKTMKELSQLSNVTCSFRTAKGPRIESVLTESYDFQLIVLLPEKYNSISSKQSEKLDELINPAVLLYDNSRQAQKSAHIVKSLADNDALHQLTVLTLDHGSDAAIKEILSSNKVNIYFQHIDSYNISNIVSLLRSQKTGLLILPLEDELIKHSKDIRKILDVLRCPLLLVR